MAKKIEVVEEAVVAPSVSRLETLENLYKTLQVEGIRSIGDLEVLVARERLNN